jgi:hypothetical protein
VELVSKLQWKKGLGNAYTFLGMNYTYRSEMPKALGFFFTAHKIFAYDIGGDTVNTAARMEQSSEPGRINISHTTYG